MSDPAHKVGTVIQWSDGGRSVVGEITVAAALGSAGTYALYRMDEIDGSGYRYLSEDHVLQHGFPTSVQPGQIYQADVHRYIVLAPLPASPSPSFKWRCSVENALLPELHIYEADLSNWTLLEGLSVAPKATPRHHGPHTCPRCGHGGALIMAVRTVHCMNSSCPCFSPLT